VALLGTRRSVHPVDRMREDGMTFMEALRHRENGLRFERDHLAADAADDPENGHFYDSGHWNAEIDRTTRAGAIYREGMAAAEVAIAKALRDADLPDFADALESEDYAAYLAF
jgi:hypothetical protein